MIKALYVLEDGAVKYGIQLSIADMLALELANYSWSRPCSTSPLVLILLVPMALETTQEALYFPPPLFFSFTPGLEKYPP